MSSKSTSKTRTELAGMRRPIGRLPYPSLEGTHSLISVSYTHLVGELIRIVADKRFGQILITDCNQTRLEGILRESECAYKLFRVSGGIVEES